MEDKTPNTSIKFIANDLFSSARDKKNLPQQTDYNI